MDRDAVLDEFRAAGALLEGHFILSSGLRSSAYLQCARVLMDAGRAERLCSSLAALLPDDLRESIELVVSPAMGGVVVGYEMGRQLARPAIFMERVGGRFELRRGFDIAPGTCVLMVEDVVTTGLSSRECIAAIARNGGKTVAGACLIDRSNGASDIGVPLYALARLNVLAYSVDALPPELAAIPPVKPGSRGLS